MHTPRPAPAAAAPQACARPAIVAATALVAPSQPPLSRQLAPFQPPPAPPPPARRVPAAPHPADAPPPAATRPRAVCASPLGAAVARPLQSAHPGAGWPLEGRGARCIALCYACMKGVDVCARMCERVSEQVSKYVVVRTRA